MSKTNEEDDLYGDLYGAEDPDYQDTEETTTKTSTPAASSKAAPSASPNTPNTVKPIATASNAAVTQHTPAVQKPASTLTSTPTPTPAPAVVPSKPASSIPTFQDGVSSIPVFTEESVSSGGQNRAQGSYNSYSNPQQQQYGASNQQFGQQLGLGVTSDAERSVRPSEMRDEGKMFVGGLNWDTTDETLRGYFSQFGKIDACTIMRDAAGRSRGFAFLTFEDAQAVNAVMVREHYLDGKVIDPKRAIPRLEHHRTQKIFVGGLPGTATNETLKIFFGSYGKVVDATVMVDRESNRSKGFGFVTFEDQPAVDRLVQIHNLELEGKMIEIKLAQPRSVGGGQDGGNTGGGGGGGGGGFNVNQPRGNTMSNNNMGNGSNQQMGGAGTGSTPFDPNAMAMLYQRMMQAMGGSGGMGGGAMNPMMAGGMGMMNPAMMGGMGMGRGGMSMGGGGAGMGMGRGGMPMPMQGMGMPGMGMGMSMGMPMGGYGGGAVGTSVSSGNGSPGGAGTGSGTAPRGPAAMRGGAPQQQGPPSGSVGPTRFGTKGQHSYHPYGR